MVDLTGLKPVPHGLKGRCSVTRAPDRKRLAVAEGLEPSIAGLTIRCLTNLATPQENISNCGLRIANFECRRFLKVPHLKRAGLRDKFAIRISQSEILFEAMKGVEPLSTGLQDRRSVIQLSYIAEEERTLCFGLWLTERLGRTKFKARRTKH